MPLRDINDATVQLVKSAEGIPDGDPSTATIDPYLDPVGIWTIGWGHAISWQGTWLKGPENKVQAQTLYPGGISLAQAQDLLKGDLLNAGRDVSLVVTVELTDNQFGALVSFVFNLGINNLRTSTLLQKLNQSDVAGASNEFGRWVKAGGQILPGLVQRRAAEQALFLTP
ncbi:MAG: glycoside hydrolase family 24 [Pseudomonas sp.]|nr:glycoside hydrolase family 24 [Pseudomonas sp.]